MKNTVTTIFVFIFVFVFLFGAPQATDSSPLASILNPPVEFDIVDCELEEEFEEYPVEDYFEETYVDTECQNCLASAEYDGCLEVHTDCLDLPDCSGWLACVGWCDAYEADDDCYSQCNDAFIGDDKVESDLRACTCDMCALRCRVLCGVKEGY